MATGRIRTKKRETDGATALTIASQKGYTKIVKILMESREDVDIAPIYIYIALFLVAITLTLVVIGLTLRRKQKQGN